MVSAPIGYERPPFPSLYWPLGPDRHKFQASFLYHFRDIWLFTMTWSVIWMAGVYTASACIILITHYLGGRRRRDQIYPLSPQLQSQSQSQLQEPQPQEPQPQLHPQHSQLQTPYSQGDRIELHELTFNHIYDTTISTYNHYFASSLFSKNNKVLFLTIGMYIFVGVFQAFVAGSIIGILIAAIYTATQFGVTPWIPFVYSLIITLYNIASSYSFTVQSI